MDPFDIFDTNGGEGIQANLTQLLVWINDHVQSGDMDIAQAIDAMIDVVRPGTSPNSHDVRPMWAAAMWVQGYGNIAESVPAMYLNTMPWGLGFAISVENGFEFEGLPKDAQHAVIRAMCAVIQMGGLTAEVTADNTIRIHHDGGDTSDITQENIVNQFRRQIDELLDPEAPDNPMGRWMP